MEMPGVEEHVERFVRELLTAGVMLNGLVLDLVEAVRDDAYPGEEPIAVVIEMLCGTIATAVASVDPRDVERASELIDLARTRTLEHLRLARVLSRRMDDTDGGIARTYG
jgi:hypothetical protein